MPDALASMYPSATPAAAPTAPTVAATPLPPVAAEIAAARAAEDQRETSKAAALARMYPSAKPPEDKPGAAAPVQADPAAQAAPVAETAAPASAAKPAPAAELLYPDKPATRGFVDFAEAPAAPGAINLDLTLIESGLDMTPEGNKQRADLVAAFEAAGAGATLARELFLDGFAASKPAYRQVNQEAGTAELKALWGDRYDAKVAAARDLVAKAAAKNPQVIEFLNQTKLGNDPKFIRKLAARAAAEVTRRGKR